MVLIIWPKDYLQNSQKLVRIQPEPQQHKTNQENQKGKESQTR